MKGNNAKTMKIMKKRGLLSAAALSIALLLSACGNAAQGTQAQTQETAQAQQTAQAGTEAQKEADTTAAQTTAGASESTATPEKDAEDTTQAAEPAQTDAQPAGSGDKLVVYFSRMGNTDFPADVDAVTSASLVMDGDTLRGNAELLAKWIGEAANAPVYEILTVDKYPVSYDETIDLALQEQRDGKRPALANHIESFEALKTVYLVVPNWWGDLPMPLYTFFDEYDFTGKTVCLFATHGGSGFSGMADTVAGLEPGAEVISAEKAYHSEDDLSEAEQTFKDWVAAH